MTACTVCGTKRAAHELWCPLHTAAHTQPAGRIARAVRFHSMRDAPSAVASNPGPGVVRFDVDWGLGVRGVYESNGAVRSTLGLGPLLLADGVGVNVVGSGWLHPQALRAALLAEGFRLRDPDVAKALDAYKVNDDIERRLGVTVEWQLDGATSTVKASQADRAADIADHKAADEQAAHARAAGQAFTPDWDRMQGEAFAEAARTTRAEPREPAPPLRVYVAGASKEIDRCRAAMDYVREIGGVITCDWIAEIERVGSANDGLTQEQRRESAEADLCGVMEADVFWLLAPDNTSTGAWVELGTALVAREVWRANDAVQHPTVIIVSGPGSKRSIFAALADLETPSDITAMRRVAELAKERQRK